jgi:hypothetical protein
MILLIGTLLFFVRRQNYNHPISGMTAFFAAHARAFSAVHHFGSVSE